MARTKGRPEAITPEKLAELRVAFKGGLTNIRACAYAGIRLSTLQLYFKKHPDFLEEVRTLRETVNVKATSVINSMIGAGEPEWAKWQLEHQAHLMTARERSALNRAKKKEVEAHTEQVRLQNILLQKQIDSITNVSQSALQTGEYWTRVNTYFSSEMSPESIPEPEQPVTDPVTEENTNA